MPCAVGGEETMFEELAAQESLSVVRSGEAC